MSKYYVNLINYNYKMVILGRSQWDAANKVVDKYINKGLDNNGKFNVVVSELGFNSKKHQKFDIDVDLT